MENSIQSARLFPARVARPRARHEPYKRSRVLSGAGLMALGFLSLSIALSVMIATKDGNNNSFYSVSGSYTKQVTWHHDDMRYLSVWTCLSAAALGSGMLLIAGRYSLRWMLGLLAFSGSAGAVPAMQTRAPSASMSVRIWFPSRLQPASVQRVEQALQPALAMATLPAQLRSSEGLVTGQGITRVDAYTDARGAFVMEVDIDPALTADQRQLLMSFYADYVEVLSVTEALADSMPLTSTPLFCLNDNRQWTQWRGTWLKSLPNVPAVLLNVLPNSPAPVSPAVSPKR